MSMVQKMSVAVRGAVAISNAPEMPVEQFIADVGELYKHHALRRRGFRFVRAALTEMQRATPRKLHVEVTEREQRQDRTIDFFALSLRADPERAGVFTPVSQRFQVNPETLISCTRALPLALHAEHITSRYGERAQRVMQYDDADFRSAAAFAIILSDVLAPALDNGAAYVPCVIPHPRGLFLGTAVALQKTQDRTLVVARRKNKPLHTKSIEGQGLPSGCTLNIRTFVSCEDFRGVQAELHRHLQDFVGHPEMKRILQNTLEMYSWGSIVGMTPHAARKVVAWDMTRQAVTKFVNSHMWRAESLASIRNPRRLGL